MKECSPLNPLEAAEEFEAGVSYLSALTLLMSAEARRYVDAPLHRLVADCRRAGRAGTPSRIRNPGRDAGRKPLLRQVYSWG